MGLKALACTLILSFGSAAAVGQDKPNVLFLIADDLAANALSCYGAEQFSTPNIDRLATRGVRFDRAYCQFPVCGPSRAAIMTGMYPEMVGVNGNSGAKNLPGKLGDRPSLAEHFRDHGYYTARVSKIYHMRVPGDITAGVDGPDHADSWVERFNCQAAEWMTPGESTHFTNEKLKREPETHYGLGFGSAFYAVKAEGDGSQLPDAQAASKAIELLEAHKDEPFFLAVGMVRPHVPLVSPSSFYRGEPADYSLPPAVEGDWDDIPKQGISKNSEGSGLDTEEKKLGVLQAYAAAVAFMDAQVGRVLDALEAKGLADNTIVVFTSDHGYHLGEHEFWQKMSLHEESVRVPLIVSAPGVDPAVTKSLTEQIDLFPTLADLCGLPVPEHCQGFSLRPTLSDVGHSVRDVAYCRKGAVHLLRTDRWAYIAYPNESVELYNMDEDPHQFTNLVGVGGHVEVIAGLEETLIERRNAIVLGR